MLKLGYAATAQDLSAYCARGIKIDKITGMPPSAYKRIMAQRPADHVTRPSWITLRPGLAGAMKFYGVAHTESGTLICISDRHKTRYYWFCGTKRETVIVDFPSTDMTQAIDNLFRGLLSNDNRTSVVFYKDISHLILTHLMGDRINKSFTVEGSFKEVGPKFIAQIEWDPSAPAELQVWSTLDKERRRKVSLLSHPIAEVHKQCHR